MKQFQNFLHGTFTLFLRSNDDRSTTDRYLNLLMQALQKKLINYTQKVVSAEDHKICEQRKVGKIILASRTLIFQFLSHLSAYVTVVFSFYERFIFLKLNSREPNFMLVDMKQIKSNDFSKFYYLLLSPDPALFYRSVEKILTGCVHITGR